MYMTLLALYNTLLYRYTGQEDLIVGSPIAGRNRSEIEPVIGFFANTLPWRVDASGEPSFKELLHRVKKVALESYQNQDIPLEKIIEDIQQERKMNIKTIFQTVFVYQNTQNPKIELKDRKSVV